jgi:DNA-binding LytR/AlgR family response regulator
MDAPQCGSRSNGFNEMKCLVIDDDPLACETVESFLNRIGGIEYCLKVNDGATALHLLTADRFDAVFLDLELPGVDGISLLKALPAGTPVVVISASSEFGAESYGFDVVDYLVKPLEFARFARAVFKLKNMQSTESEFSPEQDGEALFLRDGGVIQRIDCRQLAYVEAQANYASFVFASGESKLCLVSLRKLEDILPAHFIRIHRSYIVNLKQIQHIEGNKLTLKSKSLPIGQSYRETLMEKLKLIN